MEETVYLDIRFCTQNEISKPDTVITKKMHFKRSFDAYKKSRAANFQ